MLPRLLALVTSTLLALTVLPASPAHADLLGTTRADDLVLRNTCVRHPVEYSFTVSPDTLLWQAQISLVTPSGRTSEGVDLSSVDSDPLSGTVTTLICGSADPGLWTVRTTGSYQVVPLVNLPIAVADSTFEVSRTATRTRVRAARLDGTRYRLVATVQDRRRVGFKPTDGAEVRFQRRVDGAWRSIRGGRATTDGGLARVVVSVAPGTKVRAVTAPDGYLGGSTSRGVRLRG